jgi:glucose-1-phosphate adenylyltransferase
VIAAGALVERSVLSPGVRVGRDAVIRESVILSDASIEANAHVEQAILEKRVKIGEGAWVGKYQESDSPVVAMIGKNSKVSSGMIIEPGAVIGPDVIDDDYPSQHVRNTDYIQTKRLPYEI